MGSFLDKHLNYLNNKIKQKIICIPFVLTSGDDLALVLILLSLLLLLFRLQPVLTIFVFIYNILYFWKLLFRYHEIIYSV